MKLPKYPTQGIIKSMDSIYLHSITWYTSVSASYASTETELTPWIGMTVAMRQSCQDRQFLPGSQFSLKEPLRPLGAVTTA